MWEVDIVCISGCSIPVVRVHGVDVDRVQFPAARQEKISREGRFFGAESWGKIYFFCSARRSRISVRRSSCLEGFGDAGGMPFSVGRRRLSCLMKMKTANAVRAKLMILVKKSP